MRKRLRSIALLLALVVGLISGCGKQPQVQETTAPTVPTEPAPTIPPDGDPNDVTARGSYTGTGGETTVVATAAGAELTNAQLAAWYWAAVAAYRQQGAEVSPDFARSLDTQPCPLDDGVNSWQQYFLRQALAAWHTAQALKLQGENEGLPIEEAYDPDLELHEAYLSDKPATRYLYRYSKSYQPNTMHQAYLEALPETLEDLAREAGFADADALARESFGTDLEALHSFAWDYNYGYMYFVSLADYIEITQEEVADFYASTPEVQEFSGHSVDIRLILLLPTEPDGAAAKTTADGALTCSQAGWDACRVRGEQLLDQWKRGKATGASFGELAYKYSDDENAALNGGLYSGIEPGQLTPVLDEWCFDEERQSGDTALLKTDYGYVLVYYRGATNQGYAQARQDLLRQRQTRLLEEARRACPLDVDYGSIVLPEGRGLVSLSDVLYPDVAHERFPEVPLYLQQDYGDFQYGGEKIAVNGCGISCLAMAASYLTDREWTPTQCATLFGRYGTAHGTDGMIYFNEPPGMGFYMEQKVYNPDEALEYLKSGHIMVSVQYKGYWTTGGHYILLEKRNDDGTIQVRDSSLNNYDRIEAHSVDAHSWRSITTSVDGFWVFQEKFTRLDTCQRCGEEVSPSQPLFAQPYTCEKCRAAATRRGTYLAG